MAQSPLGVPAPVPLPSSNQRNLLIGQATDGMIMGKLPLELETRQAWSPPAPSRDLLSVLTGSVLRRESSRSLSSTPLKTKAVDCLSDRPTKRQRLDLSTNKKTVRFVTDESKLHEVIPVPGGEEYDCQARWYTRSEYNAFRQDMKMNFFMHSLWMRNVERQQQDVPPPKDLCVRGLEKFCFYSNQAAVKDMRQLRLNAVLDQQRIQKVIGAEDPLTIRLVAEILSQRVSDQALQRGTEDCKAVFNS